MRDALMEYCFGGQECPDNAAAFAYIAAKREESKRARGELDMEGTVAGGKKGGQIAAQRLVRDEQNRLCLRCPEEVYDRSGAGPWRQFFDDADRNAGTRPRKRIGSLSGAEQWARPYLLKDFQLADCNCGGVCLPHADVA